MSRMNLSAAQQAQQSNRTSGGRYAEGTHTEPGELDLADAVTCATCGHDVAVEPDGTSWHVHPDGSLDDHSDADHDPSHPRSGPFPESLTRSAALTLHGMRVRAAHELRDQCRELARHGHQRLAVQDRNGVAFVTSVDGSDRNQRLHADFATLRDVTGQRGRVLLVDVAKTAGATDKFVDDGRMS